VRWHVLLGVALALALPATVRGQNHGEGGGARCATCHISHDPRAGPYLLTPMPESEGSRTLGIAGATAGLGTGLSIGSASCLACHSTPDARARTRVAKERPEWSATTEGFLGPDLSDDHPLARFGEDRGASGTTAALSRGVRSARRRSTSTPRPVADILTAPECMTCHDVHGRQSVTGLAQTERETCLGCHDPPTYGMQEHSGLLCTACHDLHGGAEESLLTDATPDLLCLSCHVSGGLTGNGEGMAIAASDGNAHFNQPGATSGRCLDCHPAHR
jgi:predicted CXXCH cytochrome family protein